MKAGLKVAQTRSPQETKMIDHFERNSGLHNHLPQTGDVFIDVGANEGAWTIPFAKAYSKVYCFEPDTRPYTALLSNLTTNHLTNVVVYPTAVGSSYNNISMAIFETTVHTKPLFNEAQKTSVNPDAKEQLRTISVPCVPLDNLHSSIHPDTEVISLKVDVEGGEVEVLLGAGQILSTFNVNCFIEIHSKELKEQCMALLTAMGYETEIVRHPNYKPTDPPYEQHMWLKAKKKAA